MTTVRVPAARVRELILSVLRSWGMPEGPAATTADVMVDTDLSGIDSHGVSMLVHYEELRAEGRIDLAAEPVVERDLPAVAVLDGRDGLGHPVTVRAVDLAIGKARTCGIGAVAVHRSHHFGAAGHYARLAAAQGLIGLVTTSTRSPGVLVTGGTRPVLGTNPIAFAAPRHGGGPFVLDMSTSVVAVNKVRVYGLRGEPLPAGWVLDGEGGHVADGTAAYAGIHDGTAAVTPLGGPGTVGGGHKGYGLSMMVQILSTALSNAVVAGRGDDHDDTGHFVLAIDPELVNPGGRVQDNVDELVDLVRGSGEDVLVAGEPEERSRAERSRTGIPLSAALVEQLTGVCGRAGVHAVLDGS